MISSPYNQQLDECFRCYASTTSQNESGKKIYKFTLKVDGSGKLDKAALNQAPQKIIKLLKEHPDLIQTFKFNTNKDLQKLISKNPVLTINGDAVSLSKYLYAPDKYINYSDVFFSESLLCDPVICQEGHFLERSRAMIYCQNSKGNCPAGHSMGEIEDDSDLKEKCTEIRTLLKTEKKNQELNVKIGWKELEIQRLGSFIKSLNQNRINGITYTSNALKFGKVGIRPILWHGGKYISGKKGGKVAVQYFKYVPGISLVAGLGLGAYRWFIQKQTSRALGEVASGLCSTCDFIAPGLGTCLSFSIDLSLYFADYNMSVNQKIIHPDVQMYYRFLGVSPDKPTKQSVDKEITRIRATIKGCVDELEITEVLNQAKKIIYQHRNWS